MIKKKRDLKIAIPPSAQLAFFFYFFFRIHLFIYFLEFYQS